MNRVFWLFTLAIGLLSIGLYLHAPKLSAQALLAEQAASAPLQVVDVRTAGEYQRAHIPHAIRLPHWLAWRDASEALPDRQRPVVLYCEHGPRAYLAYAQLKWQGYEQVQVLSGHMRQWRQQYPTVIPSSDSETTTP